MMENSIREQILQLEDLEYKKFHSRLCPGNDNIIGVRLPQLRKLAMKISKGDWHNYLKDAQSYYYEEVMLQGLVLGYVNTDVEELLGYIENFVPKIDNWAICDSFCNGLKITKKNMDVIWTFLQPYFSSDKEFEMRFGIVMVLDFFIDENYIDRVLLLLDKSKHEGYYVKMAVAWAISICFIKFPYKTMKYLKDNTLDDFTYNKSLQKIIESLRVDKETKSIIRSMKRK